MLDFIIIQSCGMSKQSFACRAYSLYTGSYFKSGLRYAQSIVKKECYFILSAKYGIIQPNKIIEPYESVMGSFTQIITVSEIVKQAIDLGIANKYVLFIGGKDYVKALRVAFKNVFYLSTVMEEKRLCYQRQWFKNNTGKLPKEFRDKIINDNL